MCAGERWERRGEGGRGWQITVRAKRSRGGVDERGERDLGSRPACRRGTHASLMSHICPLAPHKPDASARLEVNGAELSYKRGPCEQRSLGFTCALVCVHLQRRRVIDWWTKDCMWAKTVFCRILPGSYMGSNTTKSECIN